MAECLLEEHCKLSNGEAITYAKYPPRCLSPFFCSSYSCLTSRLSSYEMIFFGTHMQDNNFLLMSGSSGENWERPVINFLQLENIQEKGLWRKIDVEKNLMSKEMSVKSEKTKAESMRGHQESNPGSQLPYASNIPLCLPLSWERFETLNFKKRTFSRTRVHAPKVQVCRESWGCHWSSLMRVDASF